MSQNLLVCQHCQTYFFTNLEETNLCPYCNSKLEVSNITYENYKCMPRVKRCKNCKRKYPKIFIKCPKCNQQLIKLSTENKQLDKQVNEIRKEIQEHQEKQQNTPKCPICQSTNGLLSRELDACDSSTLHFYPEVFQTDSSGNQPQPQVSPTNHPPVCERHKEQNLQ